MSERYVGIIRSFGAADNFCSAPGEENPCSAKKQDTDQLLIDRNSRPYTIEALESKVNGYSLIKGVAE